MSHHPRIEEVSDSDPDDMDPSDFDPANSILTPADLPRPTASAPPPQNVNPMAAAAAAAAQQQQPRTQRTVPKHYHCLYPVYFDKTRSRAEGRQVGKELAVENPLAIHIIEAVKQLGLKGDVEWEKIHPKDWANPGRVRVLLKDEDGDAVDPKIRNKHHLYLLVAEYLRAHPTTERSPLLLNYNDPTVPKKPLPAPPAPRGWKIGTILPIHSDAYTGGGVSDNPFKDALAEMQGAGGLPGMPGMPGMPGFPGMPGLGGEPSSGGEGTKKKKDKKKGKA